MTTQPALLRTLALLILFSFAVHVGILINSVESERWREQGKNGQLLAHQLADAVAPAAFAQDLVSLSVLMNRYNDHEGVASVRLYNNRNELIAESGNRRKLEGRTFSSTVAMQGQKIGHVDMSLSVYERGELLNRHAANIGLSALLHCILLGIILLARLRNSAPKNLTEAYISSLQKPEPTQHAEEEDFPLLSADDVELHDDIPTLHNALEPAPAPKLTRAYLHVTLHDPNHFLQRVNARTANELLTVFDQFLDRAATMYSGIIDSPFSAGGTAICFEGSTDDDLALKALMCGQLFLQLVADATERRHSAGLFTLPVKAALSMSQGDEQEAIITTSRLATLATESRLICATQNMPEPVLSRCRLAQELTVELNDTPLDVALIEALVPEYQQLIRNQSRQLLDVEAA